MAQIYKVNSEDDLPLEGGMVRFKLKFSGRWLTGEIPEWQKKFVELETKRVYPWQDVSEFEYITFKGISVDFE